MECEIITLQVLLHDLDYYLCEKYNSTKFLPSHLQILQNLGDWT